jgi:aspartyl-tRNA(Asn)/glutamyl-tRNA(Gln) amidotransferase subunit B
MNYQLVCGLETHVELSTKTKIFCGCTTEFGGQPNTHCCPVCIGLPGTLPVLNKKVVEYAIKAGLSTHCKINMNSKMDRKNYVYPDLPKAYQISQYDKPLCYGGYVTLSNGRRIGITRIHIEEDAGKLVHTNGDTLIDYNRGGVPLIEIVSEPDIRSIDEAIEYMEQLQLIMKYIGVSDCKMQEGSLRCDVNLSIRKSENDPFGTRCEIKNMNSFSFIRKAMEYELNRQIDIVDNGGKVEQETRSFDEVSGETLTLRTKEDAEDYRYFREPDLVSINTTGDTIERLAKELPELPEAKKARYINEYGLSEKECMSIIKYRLLAEYFDEMIKITGNVKISSIIMFSHLFRYLDNEVAKEKAEILISLKNITDLIKLIEEGKIKSNFIKEIIDKMVITGKSVNELYNISDLEVIDDSKIEKIVDHLIKENPQIVADYKAGKGKALQSLIGKIMKETKGRANPESALNMMIEKIKNS